MPPTPRNILVVCSGNTCRSPVAALFLKELLAKRGDGRWDVRSAGFKPTPGQPIWRIAHRGILSAAGRAGLDLGHVQKYLAEHRSRSMRAVISLSADGPFIPDAVVFMEQEKLAPIRNILFELVPGANEPNWVLLNVGDGAYDKWKSCGYPDERTEPGYEDCEREYVRLAAALERRAAHLSAHPELLETSSSPFCLS